jgi:hypothetical protein
MTTARRFGTLFAASSFVAVAVSGGLSFVSAYSDRLAGVHTIAGFAFVGAALLHVGYNLRALLRHVPAAPRALRPSRALVLSLVGTAAFVAAAFLPLRPVLAMLRWGRSLREAGTTPKVTYDEVLLDDRAPGPRLEIELKAGPSFRFVEPEHGWQITPQMAVWVEDEEGHYLDTLYVTRSEGKDEYDDGDGRTSPRPAALPVWRHKLPLRNADSALSSRHDPLPDVVSSASPTDNAIFVTRAHTSLPRFAVMAELNSSFDYNSFYSREAFPGDVAYHEGGNPAQPSVVYRAEFDAGASLHSIVMTLVGHGHPGGADGRIDPDVSRLTTALRLVDRIVVDLR